MKTEQTPNLEVLSNELAEKMRIWSQANPHATLTEIEIAVDKEVAKLRRTIVESLAQTRAVVEPNSHTCPQCERQMVKNGKRKRKLKAKEGQTIELERQQMRCLSCGMTLFPLDEVLGLGSGAYTPQVQEAITRLGSRLPYSEARDELAWLWGVKISKGGVRHVTVSHGQIADELIEQEVARLEQEAPRATAQPKQLVMSTDGAMVQLTSGEWREVKTVAFGEFEAQWDVRNKQVVTTTKNISYFSRAGNAEAFTTAALYEWQRRGGENAERVVAVNDGAPWIQAFIDYHAPQATRVIDFAHAQAYLATIGKAIYGAESEQFKQWYGKMSQQLGKQAPQRTLSELRLLQQQNQTHPEAETIEQAIRYLEKRETMIDYPHFRKMQVPIGSGMVESGHKVVMQRRMKQAGMRWAEANLNPMLALRLALCNKTWSTNWQAIHTHALHRKRQQRLNKTHWVVQPNPAETVTEADCQKLIQLAGKMERLSQKKQPWQDHKWIFPQRRGVLHKN